jgi:(1->4)-alpha-D-glucan 1-alpha-D-glucosylmutase
MLATNTHDTKRSADLRARLDVLTTVPAVWIRHVARWRRLNKPRKRVVRGKPAPDINSEYLYYQTLLGLWPAPRPQRRVDDLPDRAWLDRTRARLVAYMLKAAREAKTRTSWTETDPEFEAALDAFVRESLESREEAHFLGDVARLTAQTADAGFRIALARVLLHCVAPGVPDFYQGDELWNFTLVDPDNRRPVDFRRRAELLASAVPDAIFRETFAENAAIDDRIKIALTARLLRFRREHPRLVGEGDYLPLPMPAAGHSPALFAFARRAGQEACIAVARVGPGTADEPDVQFSLPNELAGSWQSVLTGRRVELVRVAANSGTVRGDLVPARQPCDLLYRDNA